MKIKQDFITNSSSASYLVFIPDSFSIKKFISMITDTEFKNALESWGASDYDKDELIREIYEKLNSLISYGDIGQGDGISYDLIASILEKLELVINCPEVGGDDSGMMININSKNIRKKISTIRSGGWGLKYGGWGHESKS